MALAGSFLEFIQSPDVRHIYLLDLDAARLSVSGTPESVHYRFATEFFYPPPSVGGEIEYQAGFEGIPSYKRRIQGIFAGQSFPSFGQIVLFNDKGTLDEPFSKTYTKDQKAIVRLGGPRTQLAYENFGTVLVGVMDQQSVTDERIHIPVSDDQRKLRKRVPIEVFEASDFGPGFPDGSDGVTQPLIYGEVNNFRPILVDAGSLKYKVAKHPVQAIGTVYDNAINITNNAVINLTDASFILNGQPHGVVTCDVLGRKAQSGSYIDTVGDIVESLLLQEAGFANNMISRSHFQQFKTDVPYKVGIAITQPTEILNIIDQLTAGLLVFYGVNRAGAFTIEKFQVAAAGNPVFSFTDDIEIQDFQMDVSSPRWRVELRYDNNETVIEENSVAGSVLPDRIAWLSQEDRGVRVTNTEIRDLFPFAEEEEPIRTRLVKRADAVSASNDRLNLLRVIRKMVSATFSVQPTFLDLNNVVELTRPRYNISGKFRVIGVDEDYEQNKVRLDLYQ